MTVNEMKKAIADFDRDFGELPEFPAPYGMPEIVPNTSHPRVWVNSDTVVKMREYMYHPENAGNLKVVKAKADQDIDGRLPPRAEDQRMNFTHDSIADVECMAYMYLATQDEYYGYKAIMCALNWLDTLDFPEPRDKVELYTFSNYAGFAMHVMAEVYDWCYDLLTDKEKKQLAVGGANVLGSESEVHYPPNALGAITGHGTASLILRDWLSFAIATYEEYPQFYACVVGRILNEYIEAPCFYYASGANFQGSSYGINKTYLHMISEILMKVATGKKIYNDDVSFEATAETFMHYHRPDGESLRLGDDYHQWSKPYPLRDSVRISFFAGVYYRNEALKSWSADMSENYTILNWHQGSGRCEMNPVVFLVMNDPTITPSREKQYSLPLVNYNGHPYGALTTRSKWDDENAWMTYCKIGEIYGGNHDHKDAGTFQIYYKGILAQVSSAYRIYQRENYGSLLDLAYNKQTISKNGLLVYNPNIQPDQSSEWDKKWLNSGGQRFRGPAIRENGTLQEWLAKTTSHQAKVLAHDYKYDGNGEIVYSYIAGDIANAYDDETVSSITRQMISVATGNEKHPLVFMTYDRVSSVDPSYKKTYLIHTPTEPEVNGNVITFDNRHGKLTPELDQLPECNNGKLTDTVILPKSAKINTIGGDGKRFWVNGSNLCDEYREGEKTAHRYELGWGRVEISPAEENISDTFFNVMYVGDADKDDAYIAPTVIESATHNGAVMFGKAVLFQKCDGNTSADVSFKLESTASCLVMGLDAGKWQVSLDGKELCVCDATLDAHLAYFSAEAGEITLKKV